LVFRVYESSWQSLTDTPEELLVEQENAARHLSKKSKQITVDRSSARKHKITLANRRQIKTRITRE
jgi:hypothetical protein